MAVIAGYTGQIDMTTILSSDTTAYNTHAWSLDIAGDVGETTDFSTTGWKKQSPLLKGWTGTVEIYTDSSSRILPSDCNAAAVTGRFYRNASVGLTGKCFITGVGEAVSVDAIETTTLTIQGASDLSAF